MASRAAGRPRPTGLRLAALALAQLLGAAAAPARPAAAEPEAPPVAAPLLLEAHALRGVRPAVVAQVLDGRVGGQIALEVLASPRPAAAGPAPVPLFVEIDGSSFLEHNQVDLARVELYAYAIAAGGTVADHLAEVFAVDVGRVGEAVWQSGLKYTGRLELAAGAYTLRVLVRNFQSQAVGLRELDLVVPPAAGAAWVGPARFPAPTARDRWVGVRGYRLRTAAGPERAGLDGAGAEVEPAVLPVLAAGRAVGARQVAYGLAGGPLSGVLQILAGDGRGKPLAESPLEIERSVAPDAGGELLGLRLTTPQVAPGVHRFRTVLEDAAGTTVTSAVSRLLIIDPASRELDLLWSDVRWLLDGRQRQSEQAAAPPRKRRKRRQPEPDPADRLRPRMARDYRQALAALERDSTEIARLRLFEVEARALGQSAGSAMLALRETELAVAAALAGDGVERLLPLLLLHDQMYEAYRSRRLFSLLVHTRNLIEGLAGLWAELGGSPELAAAALASQAGYLQEANLPATSRRLFEVALEHDPASRAALLGLAVSFEKYGEYQQAIPRLERLVEVEGTTGQGALRLAVNLGRVGLSQRQRQLLRGLVEGGEVEWVRAVAFEELARSHLETGEEEVAAKLLERAVAELPEQAGTRVLLAHVYDRQGRAAASVASLERLEPGPGRSARMVYDSWPQATYRETRRHLREAAIEAMPELGRGLAGLGEPAP